MCRLIIFLLMLQMGSDLVAQNLDIDLLRKSLKFAIDKDRPFVTYPEIQKLTSAGSPSFPSGHTSMN